MEKEIELKIGDTIGLFNVYTNYTNKPDELVHTITIDRVTKTMAFSGYRKFKRKQKIADRFIDLRCGYNHLQSYKIIL